MVRRRRGAEPVVEAPKKRGRGRPRKEETAVAAAPKKRGRGRPPKTAKTTETKKSGGSELEDTSNEIRKRFGKSAIQKASMAVQPDRISSGVFVFDIATCGGYPHNRQSLLIGDKHAGKSTASCKLVRNVQLQYPDQKAVYIDIEGTFDAAWASALGVDVDALELAEAHSGEMAVDIADAVLGSRETSLVVLDSLAALAPTKEIDSSAEDSHVGLQSRLVNHMIRKMIAGLIRERARGHYVTVLYINQFRTKIGGFSPTGDPTTMPGGRALEHASSLTTQLKNKENKGRNREGLEMMTYNEHPFTIKKNKLCQGPRTGEFTLVRDDDAFPGIGYGEIDNAPTMLAFAKRFGYWTGGGSAQRLEFDDVSLKFAKQDDAVIMLREDKAMQAHLWWWLVAHQAAAVKLPAEFIDRLLALREIYENVE